MHARTLLALTLTVGMAVTLIAAEEKDQFFSSQRTFENLLPGSTLLVLSVPDVGEIKALLSDPKFTALLEVSGVKEKIESGLSQADKEFSKKTGIHLSTLFDAISGGVTFALLDSDFKNSVDFAILVGVAGEEAARTLEDMVIKLAEGDETDIRTVGEVRVVSIKEDAFFALHKNHVLITNTISAMEQLLEPQATLAEAPLYRRHKEMTRLSGGIIAYVDIQGIMKRLMPQLPSADSSQGQAARMVIDMLGLRSITSASLMIPVSGETPARMFIHAPGYSGLVSDFFSSAGVGTGVADLFPADFDSFMAVSIQRPIKILDKILKIAEMFAPGFEAANFDQMVKPMEAQIGLSIREDILRPLGGVLGMGIKLNPEADMGAISGPMDIFKVMEMVAFISLDDSERCLAALRTLCAFQGSPFVEESYNVTSVFKIVWPAQVQVAFTPSLAVHRGFLIVTMHTGTLNAIIDSAASGETLAGNPEFRAAMSSIPAGSCMISYTSATYMAKYMNSVFSFLPIFQSSEDRERAERMRLAILDFIGPQKAGTSYALVAGEGLYLEAQLPVRAIIGMVPIWISMIPGSQPSEALEEPVAQYEDEQ